MSTGVNTGVAVAQEAGGAPISKFLTPSCSLMHPLEYECMWMLERKHLHRKSIKKCLCELVNERSSVKCFECLE